MKFLRHYGMESLHKFSNKLIIKLTTISHFFFNNFPAKVSCGRRKLLIEP
jgi:hypothetical protein